MSLRGLAARNGIRTSRQMIKHLASEGLSEREATWQIQTGMKIEGEHTSSKKVARTITFDHLYEFPRYYTYLVKMEKQIERENKAPPPIPVSKQFYIQQIPNGLLFNMEDVKDVLARHGLDFVRSTWNREKNLKIQKIVIEASPKSFKKMQSVEKEIDAHLQASGIQQSGKKTVIVQATPGGDLVFIIEDGISRIFEMFE